MEKFETIQRFALSWGLVFMAGVFTVAAIWAFWPGRSKSQEDAALSIFRNEDRPASDTSPTTKGPTVKEALK
ncbi:MAG: cbb3-type cytochrome c oxidase subunit 3 [Paracoccaceae bacterium]|nr:cbb3-type cytochrome c oxidase subunit 3 [Paracoccaceae bacterium]MDE3238493.1 cbb3-type cytochrome c oxidase subunit 3 [Paracoccaceae bacterium]